MKELTPDVSPLYILFAYLCSLSKVVPACDLQLSKRLPSLAPARGRETKMLR